MKITVQTEQSKAQKGPVKIKNAKVASSSGVRASLVKNNKIGKDKQASSAVSNGTSAVDSRPKQPSKSRSFNDRQSQLSKVNPVVTFACLLKYLLSNSEFEIIVFLMFLQYFISLSVLGDKVIVWHFLIVFSLCFPQHPSKSEAASSQVAVYVLAFI